MKFTTPCFVRVKDAEERGKLFTWLEYIGYDCYAARMDEVYYGKTAPVFIVVNGGDCRIQHNRPMSIHEYDRPRRRAVQGPGGDNGGAQTFYPAWCKESIKAYGNAVVPQLVKIIFEAIEEYDVCRSFEILD